MGNRILVFMEQRAGKILPASLQLLTAAKELAAQFSIFPTQTMILVNAFSASGDFVSLLSGPNRVVVTATKTGFERNESIFGEFFVEAFAADGPICMSRCRTRW